MAPFSMTKLVVRVLVTLVAPLAYIGLAAAEDPAPAARTVEEIVVTAQKKAENIEQVPISITAVSGDFLRAAAIESVADLVRYTPSVYFQENGPAGSAIFIRGFGTPFALSTLDPGVSLVLDGARRAMRARKSAAETASPKTTASATATARTKATSQAGRVQIAQARTPMPRLRSARTGVSLSGTRTLNL